MALYMYQASYTAKSMAAQIKEPQDPVEAFRPTLEDLGARLLVAGFPFGDYDVLVVYEAPDDMTAASVAMAVSAAGEVKSGKTTRLLSGQEWLESLRKRRIVNMRKAHQPGDSLHQLPELLQVRRRGKTRFSTWRERSAVYHEGVPGHHLQIAQALYRSDVLNRWRRTGSLVSAHAEGWALYAERLMVELGYLDSPADRLGALDQQSLRAARVVLDIGALVQDR
jgi:uncharacterized protein with GYD domain